MLHVTKLFRNFALVITKRVTLPETKVKQKDEKTK